jgi:outer membrane receptor for ferric coprogen and ferric-rhodotorulic acid
MGILPAGGDNMSKRSTDRQKYQFRDFESIITKGRVKHIRITDNMMASAAWQSLSVYSRVVYMELKRKYVYGNENNISFTYAEAVKIMNSRTFTKYVDELVNHGFITVDQNWTARQPNIYGLSAMWRFYGTPKFTVKSRIKRLSACNKDPIQN